MIVEQVPPQESLFDFPDNAAAAAAEARAKAKLANELIYGLTGQVELTPTQQLVREKGIARWRAAIAEAHARREGTI